jgi:hypothetical protein
VVGIVAVLWNAMGATDFLMTETHNAAWLQKMTPEQLTYINSFPGWAIAAWAVAVWGGVLGSLLLLVRTRFAVPVFAISAVCVVVTFVYNYVISDGMKIMGGAGAAAFSAVIFVIALLLWFYARAMCRRGVLR